MQFEERIVPLVPSSIQDELIYFIENEFSNRIKEGNEVTINIAAPRMESYNQDRFCPVDGELIRACDKLAAFIEASLSISYGIRSQHLEDGAEKIYREHGNQKYGGVDFAQLFDYYR
jgi:putative hydrolase of HD superfamily